MEGRMMLATLTTERSLPADGTAGRLVGRAWRPGEHAGPAVVAIRAEGVFDLGREAPTMADLLNADHPASIAAAAGEYLGDLASLLANSAFDRRDPSRPYLLAPADLQPIKAAGVTFATSMLERVIEEQARGDARRAESIRRTLTDLIGTDLSAIEPGSEAAERLKRHLIEQGAWSQYLEVGIGPYAEVFTKAPPMAAVGTGSEIGIHPESSWNNPEPEVVLAISRAGRIIGATLGNDVNLRDFEGRSALLLGKAKDNNASCALGPFIRLLDDSFTLDRLRRITVSLEVRGEDGFELRGESSMAEISRDVEQLTAHTIGPNHQYPDAVMLMCGTMYAPVKDRDQEGLGFTHRIGDLVTISAPELGTLVNRVNRSDRVAPWAFGLRALLGSLGARGLLRAAA
jgi:fumarylacetoacetate (FAA) hydrolase family protein